jgi:O-antigen ligase
VQGWSPIGDFKPRFAFLFFVAVFYSNLLFNIDGALLAMYFFYMVVCGAHSLSYPFLANVMEQLLPLVLANYFLNKKREDQAILFGTIIAIVSVFIMINSIIIDYYFPDIIRQMVVMSEYEGEGSQQKYIMMGICLYSFAMIAMCLAPVFLYLSKRVKQKRLLLLSFIVTCYFVYIAGITTCLLILIVMLFLYVVSSMNKMRIPVAVVIPAAIVIYSLGLVIVEFLLPYFEGTNFYAHLGGLMEFCGKTSVVDVTYDVEGRTGLYKLSLYTFIHNPIFGDAKGACGGHNFFLDHFAQMGIIGMAPFLIYMYRRFKFACNVLSKEQRTVYLICIIGFLMLGFLKGMNGIDFWTYMFVYIPCILKCCEPKESYSIKV